jgi:hypothetical protein
MLRKRVVVPVILSALVVLAGCGNNGGPVITHGTCPPSGCFSNSNLKGTYVFSVSGTDETNGNGYAIVGVFTANGSGGITGGAMDLNDGTSGTAADAAIASNSSYSVGKDGRGQANLGNSLSGLGTITLDFVLQDSSYGLVSEMDSFASGSGTIELQASSPSLSGSYAFIFSGANGSNTLGNVGNFTLGSGGSITGIADFELLNCSTSGCASVTPYASEPLTGTVVSGASPSKSPGTVLSATGSYQSQITYDVIAVNSSHAKFIEMDSQGTLSGDAYAQTSTAMPSGPLTFTMMGGVTGPTAVGGFMVSDGNGNFTNASTYDANQGGTVSNGAPFSGTYVAAGTGRYTLSFSGFFAGSAYAAYPSTGGVLLLETDGTDWMLGAATPQSSTSFAASQGYGLNLSGTNISQSVSVPSFEEVDDIAEFSANSNGAAINGVIDENYAPGGQPNPSLALTGNYVAPDANGRGGLQASTGNGNSSTLNGGFALTFYTVDGTAFPFIETDSASVSSFGGGAQVSSGVFLLQNPSAPASPGARPHLVVLPRMVLRANMARRKR